MSQSQSYCVALQPICNAEMIHVADELLYRSTSLMSSAVIDDELMATARAINAAFYETGLENLCGSGKLFFNAPREWLFKPELLPPYPNQVVVEVLESVKGDPEVIKAIKHVKSLGYQIALDDFELSEDTKPLLEVADIIKLDMLTQHQPEAIELYLERGIQLLAEKVEDLTEFERCKAMGFSLFQGYFYAKPSIRSATDVERSGNTHARLEILQELYQDDVDLAKVEQLVMLEPQLVLRLLRMINSAQYKRANTISHLHQAVTLLGIEKLRTLVSTLVLANDNPCKMLLLPKVLTRAAMCQALAKNEFRANPDEAFMVGLLSMADLMLGQSFKQICQQLPLSEDTCHALVDRTGKLGNILTLVITFEKAELRSASHKTVDKLNSYYLESRSWAMNMLAGLNA
ncbi:EAL and HDOD domain-containing protein [Marinomonas fungiae]|uniref:C-di-GMP-related signal transduction protein, contains EAL and HDOD domains n=1 Tax=Marinomonas fungiae TaxID=1137284 RepID=A0A0K6IJB9_9GAMM|nr:HDOD domain-containing protein [Marinomonas fungiae]CUB03188.1 c-di-GMP-related signal transduction protein, contains EAL and HDOD domains [Marinomonas fungiae]